MLLHTMTLTINTRVQLQHAIYVINRCADAKICLKYVAGFYCHAKYKISLAFRSKNNSSRFSCHSSFFLNGARARFYYAWPLVPIFNINNAVIV